MTPKSTRIKKDKVPKNILQKLNKIPFNRYAVESRFKRREEKKISGKILLLAFILMALQGKNTFQQWSEQMAMLIGETVSKQGLWERVTDRLTQFLILVLRDALKQQATCIHSHARKCGSLTRYKRVLIQDSTTIALPSWLTWCFPGNVSKGEKKAQLKIQVIYDVIHNRFIYFEITPFTANDQSQSKKVLSIANGNDLVLRDLGYFGLPCFREMFCLGITFISRFQYGVKVYDIETGKEINMLKEIRKNKGIDRWVMLGSEAKLKVRLVAMALPSQQANERRRKAKGNRDKRLNHSKEYYALLGYSIFITSEPETTLTPKQILDIYGLRWRIENIFKCWKSHFFLQKLIPAQCSLTKHRAEAIIYMMLIFITVFQVNIYNFILMKAENTEECRISLCKLCRYIANNLSLFLEKDISSLLSQINYYCSYDKRKDRMNFVQKVHLT